MKGNVIKEIDIHRMRALDAKRYLEKTIQTYGPEVCEVIVVHGFNGGTALREMIMSEFKSPKVKQKVPSLNPGRTRLILK
ncbi:MAG: hypothetical protein ACRCST_00355 [Turicibacter sp.]